MTNRSKHQKKSIIPEGLPDRLSHLTKAFEKRPESQVLAACCQYLDACGYFWWRQNNTGVQRIKNGKRFWTSPKWAMPGVPDIFLMRSNGTGSILYGIECKSKVGRLSPEQKRFQELFEANGGVYILARSVDDLIKNGL